MANDSSIRGVVWFDTDNSGTRNGGEAGYGGVEVWLYDSTGTLVATQVTRGSQIDGSPFAFEGLAAGTYEVRISGGSFAGSYDVDGFDTPHRAIVTLTESQTLEDVNFGLRHFFDGFTATDATTDEDRQTTTGLVLAPKYPMDASSMSHFKITGITHGRLFLNDGVTEIENGDFITAEQALAGLKFTPDLEFSGTGSFTAGAYTHPSDGGNTGFSEQVDITVNTVNDRPSDIALTGTTVKEFRASGTVVGMLSATDVDDAAAALTFELVNTAGGRFAISGNKIVVANGMLLDYEQAKKHAVQVKVTDAAGLSRTESLWITLGNVGPEIVTGDAAANIIVGGAKNDTLSGMGGNDRLTGGLGRDRLTGGTGADDFIFTLPNQSGKTAATRDIITDFQHLIDDIDLSAIDANGGAAGNGRFSFVAAKGAAFTGVKGQLVWLQENFAGTARDKTIVMADINGDKRADFHIELTGLKTLTAADFVL